MRPLDHSVLEDGAIASDLSTEGAFILTQRNQDLGSLLRIALEIPTDPRPIEVTARIVRRVDTGVGVRFEEISARDRSRLRSHAHYDEMDDAIVRVQRQLGDLVPGNLLPLGDHTAILTILREAAAARLAATVLRPGAGFRPGRCSLSDLQVAAGDAANPVASTVRLAGFALSEDRTDRALYVLFSDGTLHYAFEGIVTTWGADPAVALPSRIYVTERRTGGRTAANGHRLVVHMPRLGDLTLPVLDLSTSGASVAVPAACPMPPGTRLPRLQLRGGASDRTIDGAIVRHVSALGNERWRLGLHFDAPSERDTFEHVQRRELPTTSTTWSKLKTLIAFGRQRARRALATNGHRLDRGVEVVRYRTKRNNHVAGIVDANFDTSDAAIRPDIAIVVAPPLLTRKEVLGLCARTLVDDLGRDGKNVVVLRFDFCHLVGESTMDPELLAADRPYLDYDMNDQVADIEASVLYLERRFRPAKRVLVSLSFAAIGARRVVCDLRRPRIDLWVAPFGCPTHQDMMRNYLAGLDLHEQYQRGAGPELVFVYGRPLRGRHCYASADALGLAFLPQARTDLSRITTPITWIVGTYDHWVTRSEVRSLLQAPEGGPREVFECPTGHVIKHGDEAVEVFKLVSESISKHIYARDRPARDPDLARFAEQSRLEWSRVKRHSIVDSQRFWRDHLFGSGSDSFQYDIMLEHPAYVEFLQRQVELLQLQPGNRVADLGCGTGNLARAILKHQADHRLGSLTFLDLLPEAVQCTEQKLAALATELGFEPPAVHGVVADLEISRLAPIRDFLNGQLYGIEELVGRVEGLHEQTAAKITRAYGRELHGILRGSLCGPDRIRALCPALTEDEVRVVVELGRAARFVLGRQVPADLRAGVVSPQTAADLRFDALHFGQAALRFELDLPTEGFDRIGCSLVLPYLIDPLTSLREIHRLLAPGGIAVVSAVRLNFDPSKIYAEEAAALHQQAEQGSPDAERKLEALRGFANMLGRLLELEDDGRFRFYTAEQLSALTLEAGFVQVNAFEGLGTPPTAVMVRAEKPA